MRNNKRFELKELYIFTMHGKRSDQIRDECTFALSSVEMPEMTNMRRKEMMISIANDCKLDPAGRVPKKASGVTSSSIVANVELATREPSS